MTHHLSRHVSSLDSVARGKTDKGGKRRETVGGRGRGVSNQWLGEVGRALLTYHRVRQVSSLETVARGKTDQGGERRETVEGIRGVK